MSHVKVSTIIMLIGIPGSGKTTWANKFLKLHPCAHLLSSDKVREETTGTIECDPKQSPAIHELIYEKAKNIINSEESYLPKNGFGPCIIIDCTNVDATEWRKFKSLEPTMMIARVFDIPVDEALVRQQIRGRTIPYDVVKRKHDTLHENLKFLPYFFNMIIMNDFDDHLVI